MKSALFVAAVCLAATTAWANDTIFTYVGKKMDSVSCSSRCHFGKIKVTIRVSGEFGRYSEAQFQGTAPAVINSLTYTDGQHTVTYPVTGATLTGVIALGPRGQVSGADVEFAVNNSGTNANWQSFFGTTGTPDQVEGNDGPLTFTAIQSNPTAGRWRVQIVPSATRVPE